MKLGWVGLMRHKMDGNGFVLYPSDEFGRRHSFAHMPTGAGRIQKDRYYY
jgi:hypothetical protein